MSTNNDKRGTSSDIERKGYRPLHGGYTPARPIGATPAADGSQLPKAPVGGTGETPAASIEPPALEESS
jgi:hypothetical protein